MCVATPEATAVDLFRYLEGAGHLGHVATVLAEKIDDRLFLSDVPRRLALGVSFGASAALERIRQAFISLVFEGTSRNEEGAPSTLTWRPLFNIR